MKIERVFPETRKRGLELQPVNPSAVKESTLTSSYLVVRRGSKYRNQPGFLTICIYRTTHLAYFVHRDLRYIPFQQGHPRSRTRLSRTIFRCYFFNSYSSYIGNFSKVEEARLQIAARIGICKVYIHNNPGRVLRILQLSRAKTTIKERCPDCGTTPFSFYNQSNKVQQLQAKSSNLHLLIFDIFIQTSLQTTVLASSGANTTPPHRLLILFSKLYSTNQFQRNVFPVSEIDHSFRIILLNS